MRLTENYIEWAHGPAAEDGQPIDSLLCSIARHRGFVDTDLCPPDQIAVIRQVAGIWAQGGDGAPWAVGVARKILREVI